MLYELPRRMRQSFTPVWSKGVGNIPAVLPDGTEIGVPVYFGINVVTLGITGTGKTTSYTHPAARHLLESTPHIKGVFLETKRTLGKPIQLTVNTLEEYGSTMLVEWKLKELEASGVLDHDNYLYLVGRYSEVSGAAADFETFLCLISPFLGDMCPMPNMAVHLPVGEFATDKAMQQMLCKLLLSYIKQNPSSSAVLILDDGNGDRRFLVDLLKAKPLGTEVHMLSNDAFTLSEADRSVLMNTFQVRIYTRHEDMSSCGKVAEHCGQIDVVKHSSTVTIDRRYHANSAWDILMGTNRTETSIANAPTKEYRFRKEVINSLCEGTGIIDYAGNKVLFSF
ncbi:MAG: hypothetical protein LUJ09_09075 [Firmicutes bacterium]|nr:hypothetical protein [Bacillota bacterium]